MILPMTAAEALDLPVSVDIETAGRAFGMGRTKAYDLARRGEFPCHVVKVGPKFRVPRTALLEALGIDPSAGTPSHEPQRVSRRRKVAASAGDRA